MNDDHTKFAISGRLDSALDNLTEIHKQMRRLELAHLVSPSDQDLTDYRMLIDDLTATLTNIIGEVTTPPDTDNPAALVATSFPLAVGDALRSPPSQMPARPPGVAPSGPKARPDT